MKLRIDTGFCKCGHHYTEHHLGVIMNKEVYNRLPPGYPPYVPEECEAYGFNETGGRGPNGEDHCFKYEDDPNPCPHGCIFKYGNLVGDCRIPWSNDCKCKEI